MRENAISTFSITSRCITTMKVPCIEFNVIETTTKLQCSATANQIKVETNA